MAPMRTLAVLLLHGLLSAALPVSTRPRVALDPGHGGVDVGAKGKKGLLEKQATLDLALELKRVLESQGTEVVMVREEDIHVPLQDRAKAANAAGADLIVSLHFNANPGRSGRGSEVFFLSLDQGDEDARAVAEQENAFAQESAPPADDVVTSILNDLAQKAYLQDSERLAVELQAQLNRLGGIKQRGVKQAPFAVLRRAAMPAALVEGAFINNPKEEAKLRDPGFIKKLAEAIARGIGRFLAKTNGGVRRKAFVDPA